MTPPNSDKTKFGGDFVVSMDDAVANNNTQQRGMRRVLGTCSVLHIIHDGMGNMIYVLLPVLAQQFGLSLTQVGMIKGAQSAATALFQIPVGLLSERIGERALLASGTILAGLAFVLLAFCSSFFLHFL